MTISTLSIPYSTRTERGTFKTILISNKDFLNISTRVSNVAASSIFTCKPKRDAFQKLSRLSLILFPKKTIFNVNQKCLVNGVITCFMKKNNLFFGFIFDSSTEEGCIDRRFLCFHHHLLDSLLEKPAFTGIRKPGKYIFQFPPSTSLKRKRKGFSLSNLHLMLLSEHETGRCGLLCSLDPLPAAVPIPILCPKVEIALLDSSTVTAVSQIKISFLMGKKHGFMCLPILSEDDFDKNLKISGFAGKPLIKHENTLSNFQSDLLVCPSSCSLNSIDRCLHNGTFVFVRSSKFLDLGFIPERDGMRITYDSFVSPQKSLLEVHQRHTRRTFLRTDKYSRFLLNRDTKICSTSESQTGLLCGMSFFLLADENGEHVSFLYMKGDFELKNSDPTNPAAGFWPIGEDREKTSSSGKLPEKRFRAEGEGESSQASAAALLAFNQQRENLPGLSSSELPPKKRPRQEEEGESSQAARAALLAFNRQKEEEAAEALLLLSGQSKEKK